MALYPAGALRQSQLPDSSRRCLTSGTASERVSEASSIALAHNTYPVTDILFRSVDLDGNTICRMLMR